MGAPKPGEWGTPEELFGAIVNELRIGNYLFRSANSKDPRSVKKPVMIRRPGSEARQDRPRMMKGEELARRLKGSGTVRYSKKGTSSR